jgi:hypothetical protein
MLKMQLKNTAKRPISLSKSAMQNVIGTVDGVAFFLEGGGYIDQRVNYGKR